VKTIRRLSDLQQSIGYRVTRAGTLMGMLFTDELKPVGLSLPEWRVLFSLFHTKARTLSYLSQHTALELYTVSRIAAALTRRGLVIRRTNGDDRRGIELRLTRMGTDLVRTVVPIAAMYEEGMSAGMSADDVKNLKRLLERLYDNMTALAAARNFHPHARSARNPQTRARPKSAPTRRGKSKTD
jgi:MarR family transcriptional regulator, organic hydroperoxide resistance regulator